MPRLQHSPGGSLRSCPRSAAGRGRRARRRLKRTVAGVGALAGAALLAVRPAGTAGGMVEPAGPDCNAALVERAAWLMGTTLRATVCAPSRDVGVAAIEAAFAAVRETEARLSTWRPDSELSRLNAAAPGAWIELSPATAALLAEARSLSVRTGGAFDPAVGAAIDAWDLRGTGRTPGPREVEAAREHAGPVAWELDPAAGRARRRPGVRLDAGAFGKGAGLRYASVDLQTAGLAWAVLDFGGQLLMWSRDARTRWPVAVADPRDRDRPVAILHVGPGSVATTAASERWVEVDGERVGHVIDPRTARPVPPWGSVTVVAADPVTADALSTALFVMGRRDALAWSATTRAAAFLVEADGSRLGFHSSPKLDALASVQPVPNHRKDFRR